MMPTNDAKKTKWYNVKLRYRGLVFIVASFGTDPDDVVSKIKASPEGEQAEILMCKESDADYRQ